MEAVVNKPTLEQQATPQLTISIEFIAYIALVVCAVVLRIADLDIVPMTDAEARQALSTWQVVAPFETEVTTIGSSVTTFWGQALFFSTLGANEFSARLLTVIASTLLMLTPFLFRRYWGIGRSFLLSLLWTISPSMLVTSRSSDPVIWTMLFAILGLWALWRYWDTGESKFAMWLMGLLGALIFLTEPMGLVLAIILLLAGLFAVSRTVLSAPERMGEPGGEVIVSAREHFRAFPWQAGFGVMALVVLTVGTGFLIYPSGLSIIGETLAGTLRGIFQAEPQNSIIGLPLIILAQYETLLIIFAGVGVWMMRRRGLLTFIERFLFAWIVLAGIVLLFFANAGAGHALFMSVPLSILATFTIAELIKTRPMLILWSSETSDDDEGLFTTRFWWGKWMLGVIVFALLTMLTVHLQEVGRGLLLLPNVGITEALSNLAQPTYIQTRYSMIWSAITLIFLIVGFFLAASYWGNYNTAQGVGLGMFFFLLISNVAGGWNTATLNRPTDLWHTTTTDLDIYLLRDSLFDVADRQTRGFPLVEVTVVLDNNGLQRDNMVAWLLRDFQNVNYVSTIIEARFDPVVLVPSSHGVEPDLGGSYVGQEFAIHQSWSLSGSSIWETLGWWLQGRIAPEKIQKHSAVLWLRQDVYDGVASQSP